MAQESSGDEMAQLIRGAKQLMDSVPQPEAAARFAGLLQAASVASGLDKDEIAQALATFLTMFYQEYAEITIHHRDGTRDQFVIGPDSHYDIRPGSPYYDQDKST